MNLATQFQPSSGTPNSLASGAGGSQQQAPTSQFNNSQYLFQQQQQQQQQNHHQQQQKQAFAFGVSDNLVEQLGQAQAHNESGLNPSKLLVQNNYPSNFRNSNQPTSQQLHSLQQQLQQLQLQQLQQQQQQQQGGVPTAQQQSQNQGQQLAQQLLAQQVQSQYAMSTMTPQLQASQLAQSQNQTYFEVDFKSIPVDQTTATSLYWTHQVQLANVSRQSNIPHFYARQAASSSRKGQVQQVNSDNPGTTLIDITKNLLSSIIKQQEIASTQAALQAESNKTNGNVGTPTLSNAVIAKKTGALEVDAVDEEEEDQRIRIKENNTQLWTGLDLSGQMMIKISDKLFRYSFLRRLYLNGNNIKEIPKSISSLKTLRVLDLSSNKLTSLPSELGMLFNLRYLYLFDNDIKDIPDQFGNLVSLEFLGIEGNINLNKDVISTITKKGTRGLIIHLRDECNRIDPPESRKWIGIGDDGEPMIKEEEMMPVNELDLHSKENNSFTIMSYNTLCQHYATQKMYKYTPSWALNWDYRREKLTEEILSYSTNIVCLQEVETRAYEEYWVPLMLSKGYHGTFHSKSRAKTMNEKGAKRVDGCATFYQTGVFELIDKKVLEYGRLVISQEKFKKTEDIFNRFMNKDNIASVSILQHVSSGKKIVVANTHLHWDPEYNDVKAMQVAVLLEELQGVIKKYVNGRDDINKIPLIICGDFNSQTNSAVYQFFSQGVSKGHGDLKDRDYGKYTTEGLTHPFHLRSAYDAIGELPFTNFTPTFTEVIDYIWYSTATLSVKGLLGEIDTKYTNKLIGFPTANSPSDHIPLVTRFEFKKQVNGKRIKADFGNSGSRKT